MWHTSNELGHPACDKVQAVCNLWILEEGGVGRIRVDLKTTKTEQIFILHTIWKVFVRIIDV